MRQNSLTFGLACVLAASLGAQETDKIFELDALTVRPFDRQYSEQSSETGLGVLASLSDTPLTVMSIPMDILNDQQVNNVEDALRNVSGVSKFKQGNGGEERFSIRGFEASQSIHKDGARLNNRFNATNIATTETANIARYDVLKGPSAILYGQGEPGGVVNYITKKPYFTRHYNAAEVIVGNNDYFRAEFDTTAPLGEGDSRFAYRFVGSYENSGSDRDFVARDRTLLAPSLAWRPSEKARFTLQYEYITDLYTQDRGQVLEGDVASGYYYSDRLDGSQFFGVPDWNERADSEFQRWALIGEVDFSDDASLSVNASLNRVDKVLFDSSPRFVDRASLRIIDEEGNMLIEPRYQGGDGDSDSVTIHYNHRVEGDGPIRHNLLLGVDYERIFNDGWRSIVTDSDGERVRTIGYNIVTREYSGIPEGGLVAGPRTPGIQTNTQQKGIVVQDLVSIGDHWRFLAGLRHTDFDDRDAGVTSSNTSLRLGTVYRLNADLSYYASFAQGFTPTTATGRNPDTGNGIGGPALNPETSTQYEIGARWSLLEGGLALNAAVFDVSKQDIVITDPDSLLLPSEEQWSANLGETRTRGLELQAVGRLSPELRIIAGYSYLDNELLRLEASFADRAGNSLPGIPRHSGSFWGVYEFQEGGLKGLGLGAGVFSQSKTYISTENRSIYDAWTQLDVMAYYKRENWKLQINLKNITDEEYNLAQANTISDSFAAIRVGTSAPLAATASLAVEF